MILVNMAGSGHLHVKFSTRYRYKIENCNYETDLPAQPPDEVDKIWTISKTKTSLIISCNGVEVLNYIFADGVSYCVGQWGGDKIEQIIFNSGDTASNFYRALGMPYEIFQVASSLKFEPLFPIIMAYY